MESGEERLLIVVDTNVWDAHTLLRSHLAASMIFLVEQVGGRIVVPEVVKLEVKAHLVEAYSKQVAEIRGALDRVRMMLGRSPDPDFAEHSAAAQAVEDRLAELGPLVQEEGLVDHHFRHAGLMVLAGTAPNSPKNQQFKDCLLWCAVVDLLRPGPRVVLVTGDQGFYGSKDGSDLHPDLQVDVPKGANFTLIRSLQALVACLQPQAPEFDLGPIDAALDMYLLPQLRDLANRQLDGGRIGERISSEYEAFVTGRPGQAVVRYHVEYGLSALGDGTEITGVARSAGELMATLSPPAVTEFGLDNVDFVVADGQTRGGLTVVRAGSVVVGARTREHGVRVAISPVHAKEP